MIKCIMNKRHSKNIFLVSVDVGFMVENVTQDKNGTRVSVSVGVKTLHR